MVFLKSTLELKDLDYLISKKQYSKPVVFRVILDKSVTLMMQSVPPNPDPRGGGGKKGASEPFPSPFGDKPFS